MYQAIITKYIGPTNTKGSRIKARSESGHTLIVHYDDALNTEQNHRAAAMALAAKLDWKGTYHGGGIPDGYAFVCETDDIRDSFTR